MIAFKDNYSFISGKLLVAKLELCYQKLSYLPTKLGKECKEFFLLTMSFKFSIITVPADKIRLHAV